MFRKILIANRGEIACRVIRTAHRLGLATVAVYSEADVNAAHMALADEAVAIGGPRPADSYLRGDAIIAAARARGAEAIHPGYGFLSENPEFVEAVEAAGLTFIGPSAAAIRAMGLKDAAKTLMTKAEVPVVPGYQGKDQTPGRLKREAAEIGYPVLIKAVAGGGGKGMRRVDHAGDFAEALAAAQGEAQTAFANPAVLIEKYIETPRHIEVQVFGDGTRAIHLFERDCSLQRRHQKVLEEAPAPGMTDAMRAAMAAAAVRAAGAIGYRGAGTVEFIVDASEGLREDRFWFMEMNTRLQVEHPVTEAITGIDLVEWQLRVAAGEPLPLGQEDLAISGHAIEARLYAEDVPAGFLPATGRLAHLAFPAGIRTDSGVRAGDAIGPWYDPMIAKIIAHGPTRAIALRRLDRALCETQVAGTVTNLSFLVSLVRHAGFAAGKVDTGLIERDLGSLTLPVAEDGVMRAAQATALLVVADLPQDPLAGFSLWDPIAFPVALEGLSGRILLDGPGTARVEIGEDTLAATRGPDGWMVEGHAAMKAIVHGDCIHVFLPEGRPAFSASRVELLAPGMEAASAGDHVLAPMPGVVKAVHVAVGAHVSRGDGLAVMEAMKMEHTLRVARDGVVEQVLVEEGAQLEAGAALIALVPEG
ncbi:MAG: acetyl/propionyl/methylcrotonyl-CoA carboxylase subunit alpha [Pseudorhodobacter sp.]